MQKRQIIDTIRNEVGMDFHYKQIEKVIDTVYRQVAHDTISLKGDSFDLLTKDYPSVTVTEDTNSGRYYSILPAEIIYMGNPTDAVKINKKKSVAFNFYPTDERSVMLSEGLAGDGAATISGIIGYYVKQGQPSGQSAYQWIAWYKNMDSFTANAGVRMVLAVPFTEFEDTDNVILPSGQDFNIVQSAMNLLLGKQPEKLKEDG